MHTEIKLNEGWLFHKGDISEPRSREKGFMYSQAKTERKKAGPASYAYADNLNPYRARPCDPVSAEDWYEITLPHDYVVQGEYSKSENSALGYLHYDNAWYRKHFTLPENCLDKRVMLRFDGVTGQSTVWLNGCLMGHNFSSYNTFEFDISDYVYFDRENVLAVYVNITDGFESWWYGGGGIYRDVFVTVTDPVAIDLYGVYAPYEKTGNNTYKINFETTVINRNDSRYRVELKSEVFAPDGSAVACAVGTGNIENRDSGVIKYSAEVENPLLWDCDNPNLYTVKTTLAAEDGSCDINTTRIGFRTAEFKTDGFYLNGKKTFINGVCCHQDFGLTGLAVPENIIRHKIKMLKEMGANGYRTSHYQQTTAYLDALDEMGFLVMDEARWFESTEESKKQLSMLVKRDRNRPSVIIWSTGNEEPFFLTDAGRRIHKSLVAQIRKLDYTRVITSAQDRTPELSTLYDDSEIIGINYNLNLYDDVHKLYPDKPVFASECAAAGTVRDWNFETNSDAIRRDRDEDVDEWFLSHEKTYKFLRSKEWVFGMYQWSGIEYRGEAAWPRVCSVSGAIDLFLQKKGAFWQNLSHWTEKPMAHIVPHWNFAGFEGQEILVTVYTNCEETELFLNGKSLGKKTIEKYGRGEWNVRYAPGELTVKGYKDGKEVACDTRVTTKKPDKPIFTPLADFTFNGEDLALFTLEFVDEDGRVVPDASEYVQFTVSAPAKIVGTGSAITDHIPVTSTARKMYMGKITVGVKPQKDTPFTLTAISENCGVAKITCKPE